MDWVLFLKTDTMARATPSQQARPIIYVSSLVINVWISSLYLQIIPNSFLAIADNAYFATHAVFPGVAGNLTAPGTPWILYGGSLAGAETAYSVKTYGDILFGGIASSAPVEIVLPYPEWLGYYFCRTFSNMANRNLRYNPIQRYGPQDCVASVNGIIAKIDKLTDSHNTKAIQELKAIFGLEKLKDIRDFAMTIAFPSEYPE